MGSTRDCPGSHRFHVADVAVVHDEGMVAVIAICLHCGEAKMSRFKVSDGAGEIKLEKSKRITPNE